MTQPGSQSSPRHRGEAHPLNLGGRLNWLRAGVLGANDGLTSTLSTILTAGVAALVAGALSMAGGEYVSVSTQRDAEAAALASERRELLTMPEQEEAELSGLYTARGRSDQLARQVAHELTAGDALRAHAEAELQIDPAALTDPWQAAGASFLSFAVGGVLPVLAISVPLENWRVAVCVFSVVVGLVLTGSVSARLGDAPPRPTVARTLIVGLLTMAITYGVGKLTGSVVG
jgi:VIT1/CCC1 family predicted Fe2+/Mn2+ transporter